MPENAKVQQIGVYANLCLTVIAGCLIYLCYHTTKRDTNPTKVEIVRIASYLDNPIPCKLMFKKKSTYSTKWTDEGRLGVQLAQRETPQARMQVEIVGVASNIRNPLPITTKQEQKSGLFGSTSSKDEPIAVRLVGIEKGYGGKWDAIPARLTEIDKGAYATWDAVPVEGTLPGWPIQVRISP